MGVTRSQSRELELILRSGEQVAIKGQFCVVAPDVRLGRNVTIHSFVNLYGCAIGDDTRLGTFVEVQKGASIGKRCKISSHTFICEGVTIEDEVFIGHGLTFINDKHPRATNDDDSLQSEKDWVVQPTIIRKGASIGSGAVMLCNLSIAERPIVAA